jgi:hypothetical protein
VIEQRGSPRHNRCFFRAFVYFAGNHTAVECIVRDISDTGARLQFPRPQKPAQSLDLYIPIKGQSYHSNVRWEDGNELGVAFYTSANAEAENIGIDERMNRLEAEIAVLRQAVKHLQKNTDQKLEVT